MKYLREAIEDEVYFNKMDEDLKKRGITQERYLMMFPAFGIPLFPAFDSFVFFFVLIL
jgi:hypothetical protein